MILAILRLRAGNMHAGRSMARPRKRFLVQNGGNADIEVARARGDYLYDARGRKYIDFIMGWCVGNFGWARPALRRRVHTFRGPDYIYPEYTTSRGESWHSCSWGSHQKD